MVHNNPNMLLFTIALAVTFFFHLSILSDGAILHGLIGRVFHDETKLLSKGKIAC